MPTDSIRGMELPYWAGLWFGIFPTWEGIGLQIFSAVFVVGSYFLARWVNKRTAVAKRQKARQAATA